MTGGLRIKMALLAIAILLIPPGAHAELANENLLVGLPGGYKAGSQNRNRAMALAEWIPAGEKIADWTEMVTVQIFFGAPKMTPAQFESNMATGWKSSCERGGYEHLANGHENGYGYSFFRLTCPLNKSTGKPENTWVKAIRGKDSFYVVQKAFKFTPDSSKTKEMLDYLKDVSVCDTRSPEHPCPRLTPVR